MLHISNPEISIAADFKSGSISGKIDINSWKKKRDTQVEKQNLDYSCGSASLATILSHFYGINVSERDVLDIIESNGNSNAASFTDLSEAAKAYGFVGRGVAVSFDKLKELSIPAIVYIKYRGNDHFSVLRGINEDETVWLADPSWGNRRLRKHQFLSMWETREDDVLKGKILLIIPSDVNDLPSTKKDFFMSPESLNSTIQALVFGRR